MNWVLLIVSIVLGLAAIVGLIFLLALVIGAGSVAWKLVLTGKSHFLSGGLTLLLPDKDQLGTVMQTGDTAAAVLHSGGLSLITDGDVEQRINVDS